MTNRDTYLSFLSETGYTEAKVLQLLDVERLPIHRRKAAEDLLRQGLRQSSPGSTQGELYQFIEKTMAERSNTNILLDRMHSSLRADLSQAGFPLADSYAGVFPTSSFNAQAVAREGGYLVLLDNGCFEMLEASVAILVSRWSEKEKAAALSSVVKGYALQRKLPDIESLHPPDFGFERLRTSYALTTSAEEFVIAHEFGHIINRHLETGKTFQLRANEQTVDVPAAQYAQEFEADVWATFSLDKRLRTLRQPKSRSNSLDAFALAEGMLLNPLMLLGSLLAHSEDREDQSVFSVRRRDLQDIFEHYESAHDVELAILAAGPLITLGTGLLVEEILRREGLYRDTHPPASERLYVVNCFHEILGLSRYDSSIGRAFLKLVRDCAWKIFGKRLAIPLMEPKLNSILEKVLTNIGVEYRRPLWMDAT
jgi:hypothetical protein